MGDDTHMAEKTRALEVQDQEKAGREIGYQPSWDDFSIRKALIRAAASRCNVIQEYEVRLGQQPSAKENVTHGGLRQF